jgi:signal peptide peptidase SppA
LDEIVEPEYTDNISIASNQAIAGVDASIPVSSLVPPPSVAAQLKETQVPLMPHVASRIFNTPLLIAPNKFEVIVDAIGHRVISADMILAGEQADDKLAATSSASSTSPAAPDEQETGRNREYSMTQSGIAHIKVRGTLMKRSSWLGAISGATSYLNIGAQIRSAVEDPSVRGILLDINSPGGETHGCFELSDLIYSFRGKKPIHAVANDLAASAAYAIASATSKITVTRTGAVGSIGVLMCHVDQSKLDSSIGLKYTYLYRGEKKVMGNSHEPLGADAKSEIQGEIDRQYAIFTETVARNRGVNVAQVTKTEAGMFAADNAMPLLADSVGTFDDAMAGLLAEVQKQDGKARANVSATTTSTEEMKAAALAAAALATHAATENDPASEYESDDDPEPDPLDPNEDNEDEDDDEEVEAAAGNPGNSNQIKTDKENGAIAMSETNKVPATAPEAAAAAPVSKTNIVSDHDPKMIAELCMIAGGKASSEMLGQFIANETPTAEVRKQLLDMRAAASASNAINPNNAGSVKLSALDALNEQAKALASKEGITYAAAYKKACEQNPRSYDAYVEEKAEATESRAGVRAYVGGLLQRFPDWAARMGANYTKIEG